MGAHLRPHLPTPVSEETLKETSSLHGVDRISISTTTSCTLGLRRALCDDFRCVHCVCQRRLVEEPSEDEAWAPLRHNSVEEVRAVCLLDGKARVTDWLEWCS